MSQDTVFKYLKGRKTWADSKQIAKALKQSRARVNRALNRLTHWNDIKRKENKDKRKNGGCMYLYKAKAKV